MPIHHPSSNPAVDAHADYVAGRRSTLVSVGVNIGLSVAQAVAGLWAGSQALLADALHSLSDLMSDFVVLLAGHHGRKDPDATTSTATAATRPRLRWCWAVCCWS